MSFEQLVQLLEVASVESYEGLGDQNAFVSVELIATRKRPKEPGQSVVVTAVLQDLTDTGHLFR